MWYLMEVLNEEEDLEIQRRALCGNGGQESRVTKYLRQARAGLEWEVICLLCFYHFCVMSFLCLQYKNVFKSEKQ